MVAEMPTEMQNSRGTLRAVQPGPGAPDVVLIQKERQVEGNGKKNGCKKKQTTQLVTAPLSVPTPEGGGAYSKRDRQ